mmetsp:Transcript_23988/g.43915  ORF Transcript_23988/g.43915 Transcript_23988/m.43915 type:complete len:140 (+) Transcript_23988:408-827(+)
MRFVKPLFLTLTAILATPLAAFAADPIQQQNSNAVWFENWVDLSNATLTVVTPSGEVVSIFAATGTPVFQLQGQEVLDGVYRYEMNAATEETQKIANQIDNGRGSAARDTAQIPYYSAGSFVVSRGVIIRPEEIEEEDS